MEHHSFAHYDALVIGSGAAGFNAAIRIAEEGKKRVALLTEGVQCGTSRNTGSDKQTYYKLNLGGAAPDSVRRMAQDLFSCGAVDGDTALCEAALSARSFLHLAELGVEFPVNRYGEYVGYKTDHDPCARATSAGPLTSKFMTEALERRARALAVPIFDGMMAVELLTGKDGIAGVLALEKATGELRVFRAESIILATGGPAGIYADSVYPKCHNGFSSLAVNAGAWMQNLTEWQYGLASVCPRWNVSGSYMQALPRFVSVDDAGNEDEFLLQFFGDPYTALSMVFLKGYQWPFDSRRVLSGSSVIDLLVYRETVLKNRRVFLDYRKNPFGLDELDCGRLSREAADYLKKSGGAQGTPLDRLSRLNLPAIELYRTKGVELGKTMLEIALSAQHHNGGIAVDLWWETSVPGLFAVGECAGTHGVTRPGGSALNAGQVGSLRAAQAVSYSLRTPQSDDAFAEISAHALQRHREFCRRMLENPDNAAQRLAQCQRRMSDVGGAIRETRKMAHALDAVRSEQAELTDSVGVDGRDRLFLAYQLRDALCVQEAVLSAMLDYAQTGNGSRGSALYFDENGALREGLDECFRFCGQEPTNAQIQQLRRCAEQMEIHWRPVRPIPQEDDFFENVWREYRKSKNIR